MSTNSDLPNDLTEGEKAILKRLEKRPLDLYWGRGGWRCESMPKPAKRADFERLCNRKTPLVEVRMAQLVLAEE